MATLAAPHALSLEQTDVAETAADPTVGRLVDDAKSFIGGLFDGPATSVQVIIGGQWYSVKEAALGAIESCRLFDEQDVRSQLHAILRHTESTGLEESAYQGQPERHTPPTGWELSD